jgi:broad specificity phosphatase PhoE
MFPAMRAFVSLLFILASIAVAPAEPFVVIVRHAEKAAEGGKDPDLSSAGYARAEALSRMLNDSRITTIFTSDTKRAIETAGPTAKSFGITSTIVPMKETTALVTKLRELNGNALIVGHGNTIPDIVKALGIDTPVKIDENDYSQIFIVFLGKKPELLQMHYPNDANSANKDEIGSNSR